jgi:hypothetical protein
MSDYNETLNLVTYIRLVKMVDEATKKTVASIPTLKTKAGPRDGDLWVSRLKEEYGSLIKVGLCQHNLFEFIFKLICVADIWQTER